MVLGFLGRAHVADSFTHCLRAVRWMLPLFRIIQRGRVDAGIWFRSEWSKMWELRRPTPAAPSHQDRSRPMRGQRVHRVQTLPPITVRRVTGRIWRMNVNEGHNRGARVQGAAAKHQQQQGVEEMINIADPTICNAYPSRRYAWRAKQPTTKQLMPL